MLLYEIPVYLSGVVADSSSLSYENTEFVSIRLALSILKTCTARYFSV